MQGYRVERKGGWDTHGLPVEIQVEKELGLDGKADIERYGVEEFNRLCRESVFRYVEDWQKTSERLGFWVDMDDPYRTLDNSYIESVWWALKTLYEKDLLYEGFKVSPHCPRDQTSLSSAEVALGYQQYPDPVVDPSVYVRLPLQDEENTSLLVWTTTPWTLISNAAVAVGPDVEYATVEVDGERVILAEELVEKVLGEDGYEVLSTTKGREPRRQAVPPSLRLRTRGAGRRLREPLDRRSRGLRDDHGRDGAGAHRSGIRGGRRPHGPQVRTAHDPPRQARRYVRRTGRAFRRAVRQGRGPGSRRGIEGEGAPVQGGGTGARLPALLAVRNATALLREEGLVRADDRGARRASLGERGDQLGPRAHEVGTLWGLAEEQHRLGPEPRALLGHAAPDLAHRLRRDGRGR